MNRAEGESEAIKLVARATAEAIHMVAQTIRQPGGLEAVNLKVAGQYIEAFSNIAQESTTMLLPSNPSDVAGMVATAMSVIKQTKVND